MGRKILGTNGNDLIIQSQLSNNVALRIETFGGNDQIKLDRTGDPGGDNTVLAGSGKDTVVNFFEGGNRIALGDGNDIYVGTGFSTLGFNDFVNGGAGNDQFFITTLFSDYVGGGGNDIFHSAGFSNRFDGTAGSDTISYRFRHEDSVVGDDGVTIDLAAGEVATGPVKIEQLFSIENAIGSLNGDIIGGTNGANRLSGLAGDDDLFGFGGRDVITGGFGSDFMTGGGGADRFVFLKTKDSLGSSPDKAFDFNSFEGDKMVFAAIDANTLLSGNQSFNFIGSNGFTAAGQIRFDSGVLLINTDNDGAAEMAILMDDVASMLQTDFVL